MEFKLERFYGNREVTKGRLSIEGSTFCCYTLEACEPTYAKTACKYLLALPEGSYRLKGIFEGVRYSLRVACRGTYHRARFEEGETPSDVSAGSIILGTEFDGNFSIGGSTVAMDTLSKFLFQNICIGLLDFKKLGCATLTISRSADFVYVNEREVVSVDVEAKNWNLLDEM